MNTIKLDSIRKIDNLLRRNGKEILLRYPEESLTHIIVLLIINDYLPKSRVIK